MVAADMLQHLKKTGSLYQPKRKERHNGLQAPFRHQADERDVW